MCVDELALEELDLLARAAARMALLSPGRRQRRLGLCVGLVPPHSLLPKKSYKQL